MTHVNGHRVWTFTPLAWLALIVLPTTAVAIQWQRGIGRDPDMSGVGELSMFFFLVPSMPAAAIAFGLVAPLAIGVDRATRGRTMRTTNMALGGALGAMAFAVFFAGSALLARRPFTSGHISATLWRLSHDPAAAVVLTVFVVAGILVGLGLRSRGPGVSLPG